jgi:hypothetical protein
MGTPIERTAAKQAAVRRPATLVAGWSPEAVFTAVSAKVGRPLGVDLTVMARYEQGSAATVVGAWSSTGADVPATETGESGRAQRVHPDVSDSPRGADRRLCRCDRCDLRHRP